MEKWMKMLLKKLLKGNLMTNFKVFDWNNVEKSPANFSRRMEFESWDISKLIVMWKNSGFQKVHTRRKLSNIQTNLFTPISTSSVATLNDEVKAVFVAKLQVEDRYETRLVAILARLDYQVFDVRVGKRMFWSNNSMRLLIFQAIPYRKDRSLTLHGSKNWNDQIFKNFRNSPVFWSLRNPTQRANWYVFLNKRFQTTTKVSLELRWEKFSPFSQRKLFDFRAESKPKAKLGIFIHLEFWTTLRKKIIIPFLTYKGEDFAGGPGGTLNTCSCWGKRVEFGDSAKVIAIWLSWTIRILHNEHNQSIPKGTALQ